MSKIGIFGVVLLANAAVLFCIFNPWFEQWSDQGVVFLVFELAFLLLVGVPVFLYHFVHKKKPFGQSLTDAVTSVMEFLTGWV